MLQTVERASPEEEVRLTMAGWMDLGGVHQHLKAQSKTSRHQTKPQLSVATPVVEWTNRAEEVVSLVIMRKARNSVKKDSAEEISTAAKPGAMIGPTEVVVVVEVNTKVHVDEYGKGASERIGRNGLH